MIRRFMLFFDPVAPRSTSSPSGSCSGRFTLARACFAPAGSSSLWSPRHWSERVPSSSVGKQKNGKYEQSRDRDTDCHSPATRIAAARTLPESCWCSTAALLSADYLGQRIRGRPRLGGQVGPVRVDRLLNARGGTRSAATVHRPYDFATQVGCGAVMLDGAGVANLWRDPVAD